METNEQHNRRSYDHAVAVLEERVSNWMASTTEYRKSLCAKLDVVLKNQESICSRLDKLPCDMRKPMWDSINVQIKAIWCFIGAIVLIIVGEWIKGR